MDNKNNLKLDNYTLFLKASALWDSEQSASAFNLFLKAAKDGDASAQHNVGYMYDVGDGVKQDPIQAIYWYKSAWKNDRQTGTCCNIAKLFERLGENEKAIYWWNKAVSLGDGDAALDFAKYLSKNKNHNKSKIISLLEATIRSKHVTHDCVVEAKKYLFVLQKDSFGGRS